MSTILFLIRHGETPHNRAKRYQGHRDTPLTEKGRKQAKVIALRLKSEPLNAIYSSDLKRAKYTAEAINNYHSLKINILPQLREIDFGDWEGKTYDEIQRKWRKLLDKWEKDPSKIRLPGGEHFPGLTERIRTLMKKILNDHPDQKVVIVTHGGPIRIILMDALGLKLNNWWKVITSNGGLSVIEYQNKKARVLLQNDVSHLTNLT